MRRRGLGAPRGVSVSAEPRTGMGIRSWLLEVVLVVAALALYAGLAVDSLRRQSATFDEGAHLPAGYTALAWGDYRLNLEHPPLVKMLAAAPLLALGPDASTDDDSWREGRQWKFGHRFLYRWNDADRLLFWGRLPVVLLGCLLALAVWAWTRRHWGSGAAGGALLLAVLSPDLLAHGQLVTTDVGFTLFFFLSVVAFERLTACATWGRLALASVALGAAFATKFSAVVLVPVLVMLGLVVAFVPLPVEVGVGGGRGASRRRRSEGRPFGCSWVMWPRRVRGSAAPALSSDRLGAGRSAPPPRVSPTASWTVAARGAKLAWAGIFLVVMGMGALAAVWAVYRFRFGISPDPAASALLDWGLVTPSDGVVGTMAGFLREHRLVPEGYLFGFLQVLRLSAERPAFLMGELSRTGWWYYFLVTFALKTPLPLLLLAGAALVDAVRRVRQRDWGALRLELFLWLPIGIYWLVTLSRNLNIGHRHLLPIYPFLFVGSGRAAAWLWRRRMVRPVLAVLGLWYAGSALWIHPHHLAYFNELAGGPGNGYRLLVDSNLDWGQDLKNLGSYLEREGISRVRLSYFGTADPRYYRIPGSLLPGHVLPAPPGVVRRVEPGDVVAVSATNLQGVYLDDPRLLPLMAELRRREPFAQVGYSILLYRADFSWTPRGGVRPAPRPVP